MTWSRARAVAAAFTILVAGKGPAYAWPDKPITITVGFAAGGTTDIVARAAGEVISRSLGQPVVIENKAGAGGGVAALGLTKQPPDGYNLVSTLSTTITLDPLVSQLGYTLEDFSHIAAIGENPEAFIALPSRNWKTMADAVASARSAGRLTYASNSTLDRMITTAIGKKAGIRFVPLPTRGGAEVVTQVMGGHVELGYSSGAYYPQAKAGDVAVLAVLGDRRVAGLPDVPTLKELGYGVSSVNLIAFLAPKNLPADIRTKLEEAFAAAGRDKGVLDLLANRSISPVIETGSTFAATLRSNAADFRALVDATR